MPSSPGRWAGRKKQIYRQGNSALLRVDSWASTEEWMMRANSPRARRGQTRQAGLRPFPSWARCVVVVSAARLPLCVLGVLLPGTLLGNPQRKRQHCQRAQGHSQRPSCRERRCNRRGASTVIEEHVLHQGAAVPHDQKPWCQSGANRSCAHLLHPGEMELGG